MKNLYVSLLVLALLAVLAGGCTLQPPAGPQVDADVEFALKTMVVDGKMVYMGMSGEIDGVINPDIVVQRGNKLQIILVNGDGMPHDLAIPDLNVQTVMLLSQDDSTEKTFAADSAGVYAYFCTVAGHRQAGMEGKLIVEEP